MLMNFFVFGMMMAAAKVVSGKTYMVSLHKNEAGQYPFDAFKSTSEVSTMSIKTEIKNFGIVVVQGTEEDAQKLQSLDFVKYVEEDQEVHALEGEPNMGMGSMGGMGL